MLECCSGPTHRDTTSYTKATRAACLRLEGLGRGSGVRGERGSNPVSVALAPCGGSCVRRSPPVVFKSRHGTHGGRRRDEPLVNDSDQYVASSQRGRGSRKTAPASPEVQD